MIDLKKLRLFPFATPNVAFTKSEDNKDYNIIFYPENSSFAQAFPKLGIKKLFGRFGTVMPSTVPRLVLNPKTLSPIISSGLRPVRIHKPFIKNMYIDTSLYLELLDKKYQKKSYRRPIVLHKITTYLQQAKTRHPDRSNVLMYYVDLSKPMPRDISMRRAFLLFAMFKSKDDIPFDYVMLAVNNGGVTKYSVLSTPDDRISAGRIISVLNQLRPIIPEDSANQDEAENSEAATRIINVVDAAVNSEDDDVAEPDHKVNTVVNQYIAELPEDKREQVIQSSAIDSDSAKRFVVRAAIYGMTKNHVKANRISKNMKPQQLNAAIKTVKRDIAPTILEKSSYKNESRDVVYKKTNINAVNDNKNPSAILSKRNVDFKDSFEKDLKKSFKILERKGKFALTVSSFKKEQVPVDPGDLDPTKMIRYTIKLKDNRKKEHEVVIEIPDIQDDGTFLINGTKKYLSYQSVVDPIFFFKKDPGEAALTTMYAPVATHWKKTKHKSYFVSQIAGYWLPTSLLLSYNIGFDEMCKLFGISYTTQVAKSKDPDVINLELADGKFLSMKWGANKPENEVLVNSLRELTGELTSKGLKSKDHFKDLIIKQVENRNSIFKIDSVLENIMEPIAVEVLKTKMQPTTFHGCVLYICKGLVKGIVNDRNDISKQRIRSAEIFNYQIQKQILKSYNTYLSQKEHGDNDSVFFCDTTQLVKNLVNDKLVQPVENINPFEELSGFTKVTPIGPGGLTDKNSVTKGARSLHSSYFGNLDPMDTPENDSVGIINQLTIDAAIGNIRGSFGDFDKTVGAGASVLSTSSSIVPFVGSADGCRVMMGASQTRQTVPIVGNEPPIAQTGFETILTPNLSDSYIRKAPVDGTIVRMSSNSIYVKDDKTGKVHNLPLNTELLRSAQGKDALNTFTPVVKEGQKVKKGQILAEGKHIKDGVISVGRNLLCAVMGWEGYAFEDGYIISETVANKHFVSTAYEEIVVNVDATSTIKMIADEGAETKTGEPLIIRSSKEVEELLDVEEDELVEGQFVKPSPGGKIIAIEIYPNVSIKKFPILLPQFNAFKKKYEEMKGKFPTKFLVNEGGSKKPFSGIRIVFKIERYDKCVTGDKITNNHGGKGVLTLIEKDENMPITPWGERVEVILNPIAIINRMNPSTLYELYIGLIGKFLAKQIVALGTKKNPTALKLIKDVYQALDNTKDKKLSTNIIKSFQSLNDKQYADYVKAIEARNFLIPIFIPPFKAPTNKMIQNALKIVGAKDKYQLKLPLHGGRKTENSSGGVAVGWLYYKKLEQQAGYKVSSRSIGKVSETTGQPTAGAKKGGGQRLGEFDTWAIAAHGAETLLKELMGPLSDDKKAKDEILYDIIQHGEAAYRDPGSGKTKDTLNVYMAGMMLDVKI